MVENKDFLRYNVVNHMGVPVCMGGLLEEALNYYHNLHNDNFKEENWQLDLLKFEVK